MLKLLSLVFLILCSGLCLAQPSKEGFTLVRDHDNIRIYERWIVFPDSDPPIKAREVKGDFEIRSTVADALALIKNEKRIFEWQTHVSEFKVYDSTDSLAWLEYSYHDIPWPVSDQDHLLEYKIDSRSTADWLFIEFKTKNDDKIAPVKEDVTRMQLAGSWEITKLDDSRIRATYRILSKPIGVPRLFTDPVIRSNLMSTIKGYIKILEENN